jgi:hypothetical protein
LAFEDIKTMRIMAMFIWVKNGCSFVGGSEEPADNAFRILHVQANVH